jgi:nucleoside-diphosphate-sugar epimerase
MAVLVTGGAGFVGSHLVDRLCAMGKKVVVMDDLSTGRIANLEWAVSHGGATFVYGDAARSVEALRADICAATDEGLEAIYHLASPASPKAYGARPWETLGVNGLGTMSLIEIALEHGALFFYTSTSEVYGDPLLNPQPESYFGNVNPVGPRACYDEGKRFAEAAISVAVSRRGLNARVVRLFNCYGPRMQLGDGRLIPALIEAALKNAPMPIHGTGRQTRSLTYIDDIIGGIIHVASTPQPVFRPVNLGNDEELSVMEIAERVARACGTTMDAEHLPPRPEDPQKRRPDLTYARSLGWAPSTPVEEGVRKSVRWFVDTMRVFSAA